MTEQQTPDREKKIAEIREGYKSERDDNFTYKKEIVEQDIRFLLSELERLEREYAEEREKLINGLLTILHYASEDGVHWKLDRCYTTSRDILKEIGVTVE